MVATCYQEYYCDAGSPSIYGETGGTSAATANVAGIVALIRSYHPYESVSQIWKRLVNTAEGPNRVVNAYAAITYVQPPPPEDPCNGSFCCGRPGCIEP